MACISLSKTEAKPQIRAALDSAIHDHRRSAEPDLAPWQAQRRRYRRESCLNPMVVEACNGQFVRNANTAPAGLEKRAWSKHVTVAEHGIHPGTPETP